MKKQTIFYMYSVAIIISLMILGIKGQHIKVCECGKPCKTPGGGSGVCQADGGPCAVNIVPPNCKGCECGKPCKTTDGSIGVCAYPRCPYKHRCPCFCTAHPHHVGRPFTVKGTSRMAVSETCDVTDINESVSWKLGQDPSILENNTLNQEIGNKWLRNAEAEHASVASFARHTLQLMAIGAPSYLLMASQEASLDEIKHAKICYGFAGSFLGVDFQPGPLNVDGSLEKLSLREIIRSVIQEGCIEETLSAIEARFAGYKASDHIIKNALIEIASDESNHAQLAWNTISWFLEKYPGEENFVSDTFRAELQLQPIPSYNDLNTSLEVTNPETGENNSLRKYGIIATGDRTIAREIGLRSVIEPVFRNGFEDSSYISKRIKDLDFSNL